MQTGKDFFSLQQNLEIIDIAGGTLPLYDQPAIHGTTDSQSVGGQSAHDAFIEEALPVMIPYPLG